MNIILGQMTDIVFMTLTKTCTLKILKLRLKKSDDSQRASILQCSPGYTVHIKLNPIYSTSRVAFSQTDTYFFKLNPNQIKKDVFTISELEVDKISIGKLDLQCDECRKCLLHITDNNGIRVDLYDISSSNVLNDLLLPVKSYAKQNTQYDDNTSKQQNIQIVIGITIAIVLICIVSLFLLRRYNLKKKVQQTL